MKKYVGKVGNREPEAVDFQEVDRVIKQMLMRSFDSIDSSAAINELGDRRRNEKQAEKITL